MIIAIAIIVILLAAAYYNYQTNPANTASFTPRTSNRRHLVMVGGAKHNGKIYVLISGYKHLLTSPRAYFRHNPHHGVITFVSQQVGDLMPTGAPISQ